MSDEQQSLDEEIAVHVRTAVFGEQVSQFLKSDVGRYVLSRADSLQKEGYKKLRDAVPEDVRAVRAAQNDVVVAETVVSWLVQAVDAGLKALQIIEGNDQED